MKAGGFARVNRRRKLGWT